ncbi:hypothetical protein [Actinomadura keratinilytica]
MNIIAHPAISGAHQCGGCSTCGGGGQLPGGRTCSACNGSGRCSHGGGR